KAAVDRLLSAKSSEYQVVQEEMRQILAECQWMVLPLSYNPAAAAQGALAIEVKSGRNDLRQLLDAIHCPTTFASAQEERKILASYGGGCHQKIGVSILPRDYGQIIYLRGQTDQGERLNSVNLIASIKHARVPREKLWPLTKEESSW